jgi:hypothetical protein
LGLRPEFSVALDGSVQSHAASRRFRLALLGSANGFSIGRSESLLYQIYPSCFCFSAEGLGHLRSIVSLLLLGTLQPNLLTLKNFGSGEIKQII